MTQPFFSLLVTAYNAEDYIDECLVSVLGQDCRDFECLIGDDASTDGTLEKVRAYQDPRLRIFESSVNRGGGENIVDLMRKAEGQVCFELGADDFLAFPSALSRIKREYDANPVLGATNGSFVIVPNGGVIAHTPDRVWWKRWCFAKPLTWKTELGLAAIEECKEPMLDPATGLFPRYGWDVAIYWPIVFKAQKVKTIFDVTYAYRIHVENDQMKHRPEQIETEQRMSRWLDERLVHHLPWWTEEAKRAWEAKVPDPISR